MQGLGAVGLSCVKTCHKPCRAVSMDLASSQKWRIPRDAMIESPQDFKVLTLRVWMLFEVRLLGPAWRPITTSFRMLGASINWESILGSLCEGSHCLGSMLGAS